MTLFVLPPPKDLKWELEVARRKKKWKAKEEELRAGSSANAGQSTPPLFEF